MELWFVFAVVGALFAGLSNFYFKIAAVRGYSAELFSLYSGVAAVLFVCILIVLTQPSLLIPGLLALSIFVAGLFAAFTGILKIYALRYIDSTIYFPLFKLLAPALAIVAGVIIFGESFSLLEWGGMAIGLTVPLMLITKKEDSRQNNLLLGLLIVLVTGIFSAGVAVVTKIAVDSEIVPFVVQLYLLVGILLGTLLTILVKNGVSDSMSHIRNDTNFKLILNASLRGVLITSAIVFMLYSYTYGGTLAVVQTVHSMYILIPIVLAIVFYNEHWNTQKVVAVVLSVGALALLG